MLLLALHVREVSSGDQLLDGVARDVDVVELVEDAAEGADDGGVLALGLKQGRELGVFDPQLLGLGSGRRRGGRAAGLRSGGRFNSRRAHVDLQNRPRASSVRPQCRNGALRAEPLLLFLP